MSAQGIKLPIVYSVDFDGTLVINRYPYIGEWIPDARESLETLHRRGRYLVLNTCRGGYYLEEAIRFLKNYQVFKFFYGVNENVQSWCNALGSDPRKISATHYIDDRNIGGLVPWKTIVELDAQLYNLNKEDYNGKDSSTETRHNASSALRLGASKETGLPCDCPAED